MSSPIMPRSEKPLLGLQLAGMGVALVLFIMPFGGLERPIMLVPGGVLVVLGLWDWAKSRRKR